MAETIEYEQFEQSPASNGASHGEADLSRLSEIPMELGVETLALVAVELKLVAELHEVYGQQAPGTKPARMLAYLTAWSQRRGSRPACGGWGECRRPGASSPECPTRHRAAGRFRRRRRASAPALRPAG